MPSSMHWWVSWMRDTALGSLNLKRLLPGIGILAVAAAVAIGCSETVTGTPQAGPGATGASRSPKAPTTVTLTPTLVPRSPSSTSAPTVPTRTSSSAPTETGGSAPASADSTCGDYTEMSEAEQRAVIAAIGEDNVLVERNPELWVTLAGALCTFADPDTAVREVLSGQGVR